MRGQELMQRMRDAQLTVHSDRDGLHHEVRAQQVGGAFLYLRVGALHMGLHGAPEPGIIVRGENRPGVRRLPELDGERHEPRPSIYMEQTHRRAEESPGHDWNLLKDREIEQVEPAGVAQGGQIQAARQQWRDGLLLDGKVVGKVSQRRSRNGLTPSSRWRPNSSSLSYRA